MEEKKLLQVLFSDAKVRRSSLLAERIGTFDKYLSITEEELNDIQWVDKKGQPEKMISAGQASNVIIKREMYLDGIPEGQEQDKVRNQAADLLHVKVLKDLTSFFVKRNSINVALDIKRAENLNKLVEVNDPSLDRLSVIERQEFLEFVKQRTNWDIDLVKSVPDKVHKIVDIIFLIGKVNNVINVINNTKDIKKEVLKKWFLIEKNSGVLKEIVITKIPQFNTVKGNEILQRVETLFKLEETHFNIALLFLAEIIKMEKDVPKMADEAISTGNPFLFRSLFLSFNEAQTFAVGGKLNSSLETKYGNLFEKLMSAFGNCRGIYNGGMDVAVGEESFDIKSGPNVMNLSQVNAFMLKQRLIDEGILPGIKSYKIALGYGLPKQLNSFMSSIKNEILTGRESWEKITGKRHSPEIVFAIGTYVGRMFGNDSIVASMLGAGQNYQGSPTDDDKFTEFFNSVFTEITLTQEESDEIQQIKNLL